MKSYTNVVAVIPARSGSKGIPGKNIIPLGGKPLIAHTIEAAVKSAVCTRIICNTDSPKIARIAEKYGAQVPFLRPKRLAGDKVPTLAVLEHMLAWLKREEGFVPEMVILLQPTSPFRNYRHIIEAYELFCRSKCDSLVSVKAAEENPYWMKVEKKGFLANFISDDSSKFYQRQTLPALYYLNGAIYITTPAQILKKHRILGPRTLPYVMGRKDSVDIDGPEDLKYARYLLQKGS